MGELLISDLDVSYSGRGGRVTALERFSLDVPQGSLTVLLGESGCGKTTALNAVAGLVQPDAGRIVLDQEVLFEADDRQRPKVALPPNRRDIGMVFQSYALWPHMTIVENVAYPLRRRKVPKSEALARACDALAVVRCEAFAGRYPGELSGGQQQRIALARAMAGQPKLLLFDEPLSNLDAGLRRGLRDELSRLHREVGFTGIYVTHDQSEALALGTSLAVMDGGKIVQSGVPKDIYESPKSEYVARFFGANILSGNNLGTGQVVTSAGTFNVAGPLPTEKNVLIAFMPHAATVEPMHSGELNVVSSIYLGGSYEVILESGGCEVLVVQDAIRPVPPIGSKAILSVPSDKITVFPSGESNIRKAGAQSLGTNSQDLE